MSFGIAAIVITLAGYGLIRGGRRARIGIALGGGVAAVIVALVVVVLQTSREASERWIEFSIGSASGESFSMQPSGLRSTGITLKTAIAAAHDFPSVRVIGPAWLGDTRYSLNAVVGIEAAESLRSLLREELQHRLQLETHVESRPFDVFVLTATSAPRLERADGQTRSAWISKEDVRIQAMPMSEVASVLQGVVRAPVIDETSLTGSYNLEFEWHEDRVASVTAVLHDRFGLRLSRGTRHMDALIVDRIRRDPALVLLAHVGRATRQAPADVRQLSRSSSRSTDPRACAFC